MNLRGYGPWFLAYCLLFLILISPFWVMGEVVAPHRQSAELGALHAPAGAGHIENRKFNDHSHSFIPEVEAHLGAPRSGWVTLWTSRNELGRPVYQSAGFSPAYLPSWGLSKLTASPWHFITVLSLAFCFFTGAFVFMYCREIGLVPEAGFVAGASLATSPMFFYWLTFPMFIATLCWSAGALWGLSRLARRPDVLAWVVLAFSGYSLLMTAYPQPVVFHVYLLVGYGLVQAYRLSQASVQQALVFAFLVFLAAVAAIGLVVPVYRDLLVMVSESARVAPGISFFTEVLPRFSSVKEAAEFGVLGLVPEFFGNPLARPYPYPYNGVSVTPIIVFFAFINLCLAFRKSWGWWFAVAVLILLAFVRPLYAFGVEYLGFNLSRSNPIGSMALPLTIISAYGIDALVKRLEPARTGRAVLAGSTLLMVIIALGVAFGMWRQLPLSWGAVMGALLVVTLLAMQARKTRPTLLLAVMAMVMWVVAYPLMLRQDPALIATNSPLVEKVRAHLPTGSRFASAHPSMSLLPPNLNSGLGLASIHSYNSLSSRRYHTLIRSMGGDMRTYGRWNTAISPDYASAMFWMSNIGLMLSPIKLEHDNLHYVGTEANVHLYQTVSRMGESVQLELDTPAPGIDKLDLPDPRLMNMQVPGKLIDMGDILEFEVVPGQPSLFLLSQKFHRDWLAKTYVKETWVPARVIEVNGVFQGVLLPANAQRVRLEFRPMTRHAWVANAFWLVMLGLIVWRLWKNRKPLQLEKT